MKDPERIKKLLGKTAQLNFRLVSENSEFGVEELISEMIEEDSKEAEKEFILKNKGFSIFSTMEQ